MIFNNRIVFLISSLQQPIGGAQVHEMTLIKIIKDKSKSTKLFLITGTIDNNIRDELENLDVKIIEEKLLSNNSSKDIYSILKAILKIKNLFNSIDPDLVSIHSTKAGLLGRVAALLSFKINKVVFTEHGWPFNAFKGLNFFFIYLIQILLSPLCKTIVCTSDSLSEKLFYKSNKVTLYNTIRSDYETFNKSENKKIKESFRVGMVARLSSQKDIKRFIRIAENFSENQNFEFHLAGDGPDRDKVRNYLISKNLKNFKLLGQIDLKKPDFYRIIDCFVLLSFYEGLPRSILEAMSQSLPLIVSNVGSIKDVFSLGNVGFLVRENTSDNEIENYILKLAINKNFYNKISNKSLDTFTKKYSFQSFEKRYLNFYKTFLKENSIK